MLWTIGISLLGVYLVIGVLVMLAWCARADVPISGWRWPLLLLLGVVTWPFGWIQIVLGRQG